MFPAADTTASKHLPERIFRRPPTRPSPRSPSQSSPKTRPKSRGPNSPTTNDQIRRRFKRQSRTLTNPHCSPVRQIDLNSPRPTVASEQVVARRSSWAALPQQHFPGVMALYYGECINDLVLLGDDRNHGHFPFCASSDISCNRKRPFARPRRIPRRPGTAFRAQWDQRRDLPPAHHVTRSHNFRGSRRDIRTQPDAIGNIGQTDRRCRPAVPHRERSDTFRQPPEFGCGIGVVRKQRGSPSGVQSQPRSTGESKWYVRDPDCNVSRGGHVTGVD